MALEQMKAELQNTFLTQVSSLKGTFEIQSFSSSLGLWLPAEPRVTWIVLFPERHLASCRVLHLGLGTKEKQEKVPGDLGD